MDVSRQIVILSHESLFFVGVITFLLAFLNLLIRDLDNPFGYDEADSTEDAS